MSSFDDLKSILDNCTFKRVIRFGKYEKFRVQDKEKTLDIFLHVNHNIDKAYLKDGGVSIIETNPENMDELLLKIKEVAALNVQQVSPEENNLTLEEIKLKIIGEQNESEHEPKLENP